MRDMENCVTRTGWERRGIKLGSILKSLTLTRRYDKRYCKLLARESRWPSCIEPSQRCAAKVRTSRELSNRAETVPVRFALPVNCGARYVATARCSSVEA